MNREKVGALFFLVLSLAYGLLAFQIPLIFLAQDETFNARTMPFALSIAGMLLSFFIVILPPSDPDKDLSLDQAFSGLDWRRAVYMLLSMTFYAFIMPWIGFVIASIIFLIIGFIILGERNVKLMIGSAVPLVLGLWLLMSKVLDMYIAPGEIFYIIGVLE